MHVDLEYWQLITTKEQKADIMTLPMKDYTIIYSLAKETQLQSGEATGLAANLQKMQRTEEYAELLP